MTKIFSCIALVFLSIGAVYASSALATPSLPNSYVCNLNNSSCGQAATRGVGATTPVLSGCTPASGEFCGAEAMPGTGYNAVPVYAWNHCRYIKNNTTSALFVPFGNTNDWTAFRNNVQAQFAILQDCSLPATYVIGPDATCSAPTFTQSSFSTSATVNLPFERVVSPAYTEQATAKFACSIVNGPTWYEYETVIYTGLDAEQVVYPHPSWSAGTPVCSMVPPGAANYPVTCVAPSQPLLPITTTCTATNPTVGSFANNGSYVIQGTGNDYNLVGSSGTVLMSGFNHSAAITGDDNNIIVSGNSDCLALNGSDQKITVSGGTHTINMSGSGAAITLSGANDNITLNVSNGNNVSLLISGVNINVTIVGSSYSIVGISGTGNMINGVPFG